MDVATLFEPFALGPLTLRNRFVMSPMTREHSPKGVPGADVVEYYRRRAGSAGLIITEGVYVSHRSAGVSDRVPHLYGQEALRGWAAVVSAVHAAGSPVIPQLWHRGAARRAGAPPYPEAPIVSPSGIGLDGRPTGQALTPEHIDEIATSFVDAAVAAQRLGFDGVELHGAHGYLFDNFLWASTNRRVDEYGGSPAKRARFAAEVVSAIRSAVGPDFPILFRFSQWKISDYEARIAESPDELEQLLTPIAEAGVTLWDVSTRRYWRSAFEGSDRSLAAWTRHVTGLPVMAVGSVGVRQAFLSPDEEQSDLPTIDELARAVADGQFQLVGVGRAMLSDPDWVEKVREGRFRQVREYRKEHESVLW